MKPTQVTELFATIKKTFVSFFSILMFVALGVGVFLGISWAGPALQNGAESLFHEGRFHNFQVQYLYGLTDDDLKELAQVEGVSQVEGLRQSFQTLRKDGVNYTVKVEALGQDIDTPILLEGALPVRPDEVALNAYSAQSLGLKVGDVITFEHDANAQSNLNVSIDADEAGKSTQTANTSGMKYLNSDTFKVTAVVDSASYAAESSETFGFSNAASGAVNALAWVTAGAFDASAYQNGYPLVNVKCEGLEGLSTFTDKYEEASDVIEARIAKLGNALAAARFDDLHSQAEGKIDNAEKQLAEGKQKIADGERQLADGRIELETKKAEGEQKLADAYQQLLSYEDLRAYGASQLAEARAKVREGEEALAEVDAVKSDLASSVDEASAFLADQDEKLARGEITQEEHDANLDAYGAEVRAHLQSYADRVDVTVPVIDHTNLRDVESIAHTISVHFEDLVIPYEDDLLTVAQARALLEEGRTQLAAAEAEYYQRSLQLDEGWAEYYAGQNELDRLVAEGEQKLADGEKELADAQAKVAENEPKISAAKEQLEALKAYEWAVMPRAFNGGVAEVNTFSSVTNRLSISMAALFIIVGLLVSYFAVSRLVHEQVTQIGTKKALGFRKAEITRSFLLYSGAAVLVGSIIGAIAGFFLVEGIIGGVLGGMFVYGPYPAYFGWGLFVIMTLLELCLILGATYLACRNVLKRHAVDLLRGEKPPEGKTRFYEKWGLWERLPLFLQTIVNNCVNDRRRMLSTIVGVSGCTALIVTAITLNNDVMKSYDYHYENVYGFNAITYVQNDPAGAADDVEKVLQGKGATTAQAYTGHKLMEMPDGGSAPLRVVVPHDEESFRQLYHVNTTEGAALDLSAQGAWISRAYAEHTGAKVGDIVKIDDDGAIREIPILGIYEFWLTYHEMVMGADYAQKEFGNIPVNTVFAQTGDTSVADMRSALADVAGFDSITDDATYQYGNFETFSKVSAAVVAIYLVLSALMAVVVLLNLNVMFIEEKKRELIVLMINGFGVKDAKRYIYYDSIVLTVLGIIIGIVLGCAMGSITVATIEPSTGVFVKSVDLWAIAIGIVGSAVLASVMGAIALRRIPRFNLTDINKQ